MVGLKAQDVRTKPRMSTLKSGASETALSTQLHLV